jgi:uncharacterized protein (TIRG00374 family)
MTTQDSKTDVETLFSSALEAELETEVKPQTPKQRALKTLKSAIKLIVSVALLGLMLHLAGAENTFSRLAHANLWYLPLGVALYLGSQAISTYRWSFLSHALGFFLPFGELYRSYLIGMFFNMFLPGSIGGDGVRLVWLAKRCNRRKREALLTLLAERGVGLVALLILTSCIAMLPVLHTINLTIPLKLPVLGTLAFDLRILLLTLSFGLFAGYVSLYILPLERLDKRFPFITLLEQASVYWKSPNLLVKSVSMSIFVHILMITIHYMIAVALGIKLDPMLLIPYLAVTYGVVSLASVLPISANGFGVREGIYWLLLTRLGISGETALAFAFYWDAVTLLTAVPGGILLLLNPKKDRT